MSTTIEKVTSRLVRKVRQLLYYLVACLGEFLRQIVLFPAVYKFVSITSVNAGKLTGRGPYVFAANHSSHLDAPVILAALPLRIRMRLSIAAAADYFFSRRWKGLLARLILNAFPFERQRPGSVASLAYTRRLLRQGRSLLIFPEGTRSKDGHIQHFKHGIGQIVSQSSISVVPTWIDGTFAAMPKGTHWPHRKDVVVTFGRPLKFDCDDDPVSIAAAVECAVRELVPQL